MEENDSLGVGDELLHRLSLLVQLCLHHIRILLVALAPVIAAKTMVCQTIRE